MGVSISADREPRAPAMHGELRGGQDWKSTRGPRSSFVFLASRHTDLSLLTDSRSGESLLLIEDRKEKRLLLGSH